ncbi:MAG: MBL fold metallo-hydrolase [Deltaproteobacteria bacterium]|nr:MBL fold metallo-hydrolase [Candidatus Zymogenaceae bacterium]
MTRHDPTPGIHTITTPALFPLSPVNAYLIDGDIPTLIDTGLDTDTARRAFQDTLSGLGRKVSDIGRIILTHGHIDHIGFVERIREESGASVYMHTDDARYLLTDIDEHVAAARDNIPFFCRMGIPKRDVERMVRLFTSVMRRFFQPLTDISHLEEGDALDCGGVSVSIIHTPGHTPGSISLLEPESGAVFSGDHITSVAESHALVDMRTGPANDLRQYISSLRKLADLSPSVICPGHGEMIGAPRTFIGGLLSRYEDTSHRISEFLDTGFAGTPAEIASALFPDISRDMFASTVFEVYSALALIEREGGAVSLETEEAVSFKGVVNE